MDEFYKKIVSKIKSFKIIHIASFLVILLSLSALLFLVKYSQERIPAKNSSAAENTNPTRGQVSDLWADVILGKSNFSDVVPNSVTSNKFFYPRSVIVDRSANPNHLYIYDGSNNRIIGIKDIDKCVSQSPNCQVDPNQGDIVIGQPNFTSSACNGDSGYQAYPNQNSASASSLCNLPIPQLSIAEHGDGSSMFVSGIGDLYVTDMENSRVLKFNNPFATDTVADDVWGQSDFIGSSCNKGQQTSSASSLCMGWSGNNNWTAGVDVDTNGNLWVADNKNNRVLRFPAGSHTADLVLGQQDFSSNTSGNGLNQLNAPAVVRVNAQGWVYVADYQNNRILRYKNPATNALGEIFGPSISFVDGLDFDPNQPGKIWVAAKSDHVFYLLDETTGLSVKTLGVPRNGNILNNPSGSLGIDLNGNYYVGVPGGDFGNDIVYYPANGPFDNPNKNLFNGKNIINKMDAAGITGGSGVLIAGSQLIVQDSNSRILFWNDLTTLSNGKPADGVLEVSNFNTTQKNVQGAGGEISAIGASNNYLYVARGLHDKPVRVEMYRLPLVTGESPLTTYLSYPFTVLGGGQINTNHNDSMFWGIAPAADDSYVWISHWDTNRVFRVRNPLTNPVVDVILGQLNSSGTLCNRGGAAISGALPNSFCYPGPIAFDKLGNLYVADDSLEIQGNMRLMIFDRSLFPVNNSSVIYAPAATYIKANIAAWQPAFDSNNRMVLGYNPYWTANPKGGWFPGIYNNPLSNNSTPDNYLNDYYSMAISAAFDQNGNLFMGDGDRSRVLIYANPLGGVVQPSNIPTPTNYPPPTLIPSSTPSPRPTPTVAATSKPKRTPRPK